ncbi:MAG: DNA endonuclease SmrA [Proteobacteria bacterium]|nr:DNA endonuclease SmrA [Pseudomonadota bacterium]
MTEDERALFELELGGVKPLKQEARVVQSKRTVLADEALLNRREAALVGKIADRNSLAVDGIVALDPWYVLDFKRPGIQNGVFRKLKQGRYDSEARLDLHRMRVVQARVAVFEFIEQSIELGLRTVMIVHGRGEKKAEKEQSAILKGYVNHWLQELDAVQAFHSAQPQHGGTGAAYVLLRKSEQQKQVNRERFMRN